MYRSGKPFHGSARLFFYLFIHVLSTRFLLAVEVARTSTSQSEIEEAQKTVGRFLRNGVGTTWLSDLAKTRSTPLTTEDIVRELLRTTKPNGRVWRAASVLSEALKSKNHEGLRPASIIGRSDNWKDIIAGVEKEDDIICLYRKNTEETSKKSEDWQKFLKTVSPGYAIHLAIDTGLKYVICLKKIDVPEVTSTELSSSVETTLPAGSTEPIAEVTSTMTTLRSSTIGARPAAIPTSAMKIRLTSERSDIKSEENKCCVDEELEETEDNERTMKEAEEEIDKEDLEDAEEEIDNEDLKDDEENYSIGNSFENEHAEETEEIKEYLSGQSKDYRGSFENGQRGVIASPTGLRRFNSMNFVRPSSPSIPASGGHGELIPESSKKDPRCGRPIILMVQPGNFPDGNFPPPPLRLPVQRSSAPPTLAAIPRRPPTLPGWSRPFNPRGSANNYPWSMSTNNLGKPSQGFSAFMRERLPLLNFPRNTNFRYKLPSEVTRLGSSVKKSIFQRNRNMETEIETFAPKIRHKESWRAPIVQRRPSVIVPRRVERLPVPNIRNKALPVGGPSAFPRRPQEATDIAISTATFPDRSDLIRYNFLSQVDQERKKQLHRQLMVNRLNSQSAPPVPISKLIFNSALSRPIKPSVVQLPRSWIFPGSPVQKSPTVNQALPVPLSVQPARNSDRTMPRPINVSHRPPANNFFEARHSQSMTNAFTPMIQRQPIFEGIRANGPCVKDPVDQLQHYPAACPSPCERPIKLQIVIQEPSKLSVLTEHAEAEIVGSGNPAMPHGSRSDTSGRRVSGESGKAKKIEPEVAEVERRMEKAAKKETKKDKESEDEAFVIDDTSESDESEREENSTTASGNETTSNKVEEGNAGHEVGERFLDQTTSSLEANSTTSAITNPTLIV